MHGMACASIMLFAIRYSQNMMARIGSLRHVFGLRTGPFFAISASVVLAMLAIAFAFTALHFEYDYDDLYGCGPLTVCFFDLPVAYASVYDNNYLSVSAQSDVFGNHFAGSMVVEVEIHDPVISDTDGSAGEPHVSINGNTLRMMQARNGYWYGYFANIDAARNADQTSLDGGVPGRGLDFGVFCGADTPASVLGITFSDSDAVAVPRSEGLSGHADGRSAISACGGDVSQTSPVINNVVRSPPSLSSYSSSNSDGGGGDDDDNGNREAIATVPNTTLHSAAWPVVQLFSFSGDVRVQYERGGDSERVVLRYGDVPSISYTTDRAGEPYPARAEVILHVYDPQLNQDPTDEDSWTFGVSPGSASVFYHAFYAGGRTASDGSSGLVDLHPYLDRLGFDDNGRLVIDTRGVIELKPNKNQPATFVSDGRGAHYSDIVTLVETRPDSGVFTSVDSSGISTMRIAPDAARGTSAVITYDDRSTSVLTGSHTASLDLPRGSKSADTNDSPRPIITVDADGWRSGMRIPIVLHDADQNIRPNMRDDLDVYRNDALMPSIRIGSPLTAHGASSVILYADVPDGSRGNLAGADSVLASDAVAIPVLSSDSASSRLYLDVGGSRVPDGPASYGAMSIRMPFSASDLYRVLVDTESSSSTYGTNWIHVDARSIEMALDSAGKMISDASMSLYFGDLSDDSPLLIADNLGSAQSLVYIQPEAVSKISSKSGAVYVVFETDLGDGMRFDTGLFGDLASSAPQPPMQSVLPITVDVFSFGVRENNNVNNALYRLELEETTQNSGIFEGTLEFAAANQLNIDDPDFASRITPTGNNVKFITLGSMTQEDSITITYPDLARVGSTVPQSLSSTDTEIAPKSGTVSVSSPSGVFRFGTPVTVTLHDPDLNLSADTIEVYRTVDDVRLPSVDTVGSGSHTLLEIKFKDIRYKRCIVDGTEYGGLASSGFALVETGPRTGTFEGVFKMPAWICNKSGSDIISTAGGSLDVVYYDSRDSSGQPSRFSTLHSQKGSDTSSAIARGHTGALSDQKNTLGDTLGAKPDADDAQRVITTESGGINSDTAAIQPPSSSLSPPTPQPTPPLLPREPSLAIDHKNILLDAKDTAVVTVSGNVGVPVSHYLLSIHLVHPDLTVQTFNLRAGADGRYGLKITLKDGVDMPGTYVVNVTSADTHMGSSSFHVESVRANDLQASIPSNNTRSFGLEHDVTFYSAFEGMAKHGIVTHESFTDSDGARISNVPVPIFPSWLEGVTVWWSDGLVSDLEFARLVQHMIDADLILIADGN